MKVIGIGVPSAGVEVAAFATGEGAAAVSAGGSGVFEGAVGAAQAPSTSKPGKRSRKKSLHIVISLKKFSL
jgi:hypothetical protein